MPGEQLTKSSFDVKKSSKPVVIILFLCTKLIPILLYLLSAFFFDSQLIMVTCVTLLAAIDFWYTKNVAGR